MQYLIPRIKSTTPMLIDHIVCKYPQPMEGKLLTALSDDEYELRCMDKYGSHPENDSALLVALLIGVLLGVPMTFAAMFIYQRGCRKGRSSDYSRAFYSRASSSDLA